MAERRGRCRYGLGIRRAVVSCRYLRRVTAAVARCRRASFEPQQQPHLRIDSSVELLQLPRQRLLLLI
ncbi:MAG: hypothetical protein ACRD3D_06925 [Terriglobia bacterium]